MLLLTGCAKERLIETPLPVSTQATKAVWDYDGNAANVDHWIMEVYDKDDALYDRKELTGHAGLDKTELTLLFLKAQFRIWE